MSLTQGAADLEAEVGDPCEDEDETTAVALGERSPHCAKEREQAAVRG